MIQFSEKQQQAKFVYMNYPDISVGLLDANKKKLLVNNGIVCATYTFDNIRDDIITGSFGNDLGGCILRLCKALNAGDKLTKDLMESLEVKEVPTDLETIDD